MLKKAWKTAMLEYFFYSYSGFNHFLLCSWWRTVPLRSQNKETAYSLKTFWRLLWFSDQRSVIQQLFSFNKDHLCTLEVALITFLHHHCEKDGVNLKWLDFNREKDSSQKLLEAQLKYQEERRRMVILEQKMEDVKFNSTQGPQWRCCWYFN